MTGRAKNYFVVLSAFLLSLTFLASSEPQGQKGGSADWFYPEWAARAPFNKPILVRDTDSALGRYSLETKEISLKDMACIHGRLCDGLVISFIEIRAVLGRLFPDGIVDRTDLRAVSKNGPCWADAAAMMTGARINFGTLSIDNSIGDGFIIQSISTQEAFDVRLKPGVFPADQAVLEGKIRKAHSEGKRIDPGKLDLLEKMADALSLRLLSSPPQEILDIKPLPGFKFSPNVVYGERGDTINKNVPRIPGQRKKQPRPEGG